MIKIKNYYEVSRYIPDIGDWYEFSLPWPSSPSHKDVGDLMDWLADNEIKHYAFWYIHDEVSFIGGNTNFISFKNEADAIAFKLGWL